ncbi:hypothetical protein JOB18_049162 [Solea senegalensis]|uniref:Uncharacterized protein n=1 Tax=Solea senegalensis TaxID=28829 RepID=A0AAV6R4A0_SOLSE|nr:hypothetical protein JOB18_049162 [Solea senegalensis]
MYLQQPVILLTSTAHMRRHHSQRDSALRERLNIVTGDILYTRTITKVLPVRLTFRKMLPPPLTLSAGVLRRCPVMDGSRSEGLFPGHVPHFHVTHTDILRGREM